MFFVFVFFAAVRNVSTEETKYPVVSLKPESAAGGAVCLSDSFLK